MSNTLKIAGSLVIVVAVIVAAILFAKANNDKNEELRIKNQADNYQASVVDSGSGTVEVTDAGNNPKNEVPSKPMNKTTATFNTSMGSFTIELDTTNTPNTAANFKKLATEGFYNGTRFHRVIAGFMVQGGDPQSADTMKRDLWGTGGPGYKFADEIKPTNNNVKGTISMANSGPNTNGSQFFINVADNTFLNPKHTVFGHVTSGYDIVEKMSTVATRPGDQPVTDIVVTSVVIK